MLQHITYILPQIAIITGIFHLFIMRVIGCEKTKIYASMARFWILLSLLCSILFSNRNINIFYIDNNSYSLLFILISYALIYTSFILSANWFLSKKQTGFFYYILIMLAAVIFNTFISAEHILIIFISYVALNIINYGLLKISGVYKQTSLYPLYTFGIIIIFGLSLIYVTELMGPNINAAQLMAEVLDKENHFLLFMAIAGILIPFLYSLGVVPFHTMREQQFNQDILPINHYFAVIMPIIYWGVFFKLNYLFFPIYSKTFSQTYMIMGLLSIVYGSIGSNIRTNLHCLYEYGSIYYFGILLILLSIGTRNADFTAFACLFIYIIGLNALYIIFYGLKNHGEYLSSIQSLSGLAQTRLYMAIALLISLFSIVGLPPLIGFLGQLNAIYEILSNQRYISAIFICVGLVFLAKAYLEIMKTTYDEKKMTVFDTESKDVIYCLLFNMIIILGLTYNPFGIMDKIKDMFYVIFL